MFDPRLNVRDFAGCSILRIVTLIDCEWNLLCSVLLWRNHYVFARHTPENTKTEIHHYMLLCLSHKF